MEKTAMTTTEKAILKALASSSRMWAVRLQEHEVMCRYCNAFNDTDPHVPHVRHKDDCVVTLYEASLL